MARGFVLQVLSKSQKANLLHEGNSSRGQSLVRFWMQLHCKGHAAMPRHKLADGRERCFRGPVSALEAQLKLHISTSKSEMVRNPKW